MNKKGKVVFVCHFDKVLVVLASFMSILTCAIFITDVGVLMEKLTLLDLSICKPIRYCIN